MVWITKPLDPPWFFQSPLSQSFAVGNPDTSCWMHGMTPHSGMGTGRQRAEAVVRKGLCYSGQAAKNPAPGSRSQHWQCQVFTHHSWSAGSTSGSFRRQEVERGSMAECIIGIYTSSMFGMTKTFCRKKEQPCRKCFVFSLFFLVILNFPEIGFVIFNL